MIQTAPAGQQRLAITMSEHTALCHQMAWAFGNDQFEALAPLELMIYVISNHDAGWLEFDRDPAVDATTGLPYNLAETPPEHITVTSKLSPDFNERHHPFCGLISSMPSWGLYNGRYGLSKLVLLDKIAAKDQPVTDKMLKGELDRQKRLKIEVQQDGAAADRLDDRKLFQNYKRLQFIDTLALYFNRIHPSERVEQQFQSVPVNSQQDVTVTIRPRGANVYALSPFPFVSSGAEYGFGGRRVDPGHGMAGGWATALKQSPAEWECFRLVAA